MWRSKHGWFDKREACTKKFRHRWRHGPDTTISQNPGGGGGGGLGRWGGPIQGTDPAAPPWPPDCGRRAWRCSVSAACRGHFPLGATRSIINGKCQCPHSNRMMFGAIQIGGTTFELATYLQVYGHMRRDGEGAACCGSNMATLGTGQTRDTMHMIELRSQVGCS